MTESERALAALHLRARVALAIAILAFVGIAREAELISGDVPARALAVGLALAGAAGIEQLATRRMDRHAASTVGTLAEFFAFALGLALFDRFHPLTPAAFLWPIAFGTVALRRTYQLYLALVGGAIVVEIAILRPGSAAPDVIGALGWAALYLSSAALAGALGQSYRRAQRQTESAYASVATVTAATSYPELGRILVAYAERALDLPQDAAAVLLFDDRGIGVFNAVDARGVDPERRARFRLSGADLERIRSLAGPDGAFVSAGAAFGAAGAAPDELRNGWPFILPLRDARRLVGFAVFASQRARRITAERRAELGRVAGQVATTAVWIRGGKALEGRRAALASVLELKDSDRAEMQVAMWLARSAREVTRTGNAAVIQDMAGGLCRVVYALGLPAADVTTGCLPMLDEARRRGAAVVVTDGGRERRIELPAFLRAGAAALLPIHGHGTYLLIHHAEREGLSAGDLQLLVTLCDQAAGLLADTYAASGAAVPLARSRRVEPRLVALAAHLGGVATPVDAEARARIIDALRLAIEGNQPSLAGSGERVAALAGALADELQVDAATKEALYVAALLRDVGELGIDRRVLDTPGALSVTDRDIVRGHPALGETILAAVGYLVEAARIVRSHHEHWDGTGYPDRLSGTAIPPGARILRVADAFVAMTSERPYRTALRPAEALAALISGSGTAFEPAAVEAFVALSRSGRMPLLS